jgi:hypothetical protein
MLPSGSIQRPTHSEVRANLEFESFFVAPFVWAFLFIAGLWLLRRPLTRREAVAVRGGTVLTGICAGAAIAVAGVFVFAQIIFTLTDF